MFAARILTLAVAAGISAPVWAQNSDDGPGRGVARVSLMNGDVSVHRGDSGDFIAAGLNQPLVVQDRLITGTGSRAELQFDWANFLRLAGNAEVRLAELENRRYLVQIARGTVTWRVLRDQDSSVEISTPSVSVRPVRKGTYRVTVLEDGASQITVRSGEAEIFTPRGSERLRSGRTMMARGTAADPEFRVVSEVDDDDWDRWNIARDRDLERSRSYDYVSRDIYGAEDLDHHGRWMHVPSYGWVWSPRVVGGWAPYRYGRWSWVDWYGWSWVSYDPWGWAPYHYGRWFYHAPVGWCWWPGSIGVRHYWSPGLVAFVGFGGVNVGVGWGRVGWIPLAPYEPYHRWYGSRYYGGRYYGNGYNNVTVVNNVNITNVYRNSRVDRAVTVVDNDGFRRGRTGEGFRGNADDFRQASLARGPLPVTPERESQRVADRDASVRTTDARTSDRFFSSRRPAEVQRVSFDEQRRGVEQMTRSSFAEAGRGSEPGRGVDTGRGSDSGGLRRATTIEPARGVDAGRSAAQASEQQRGWRRVGEQPGGAAAPDRLANTPAAGSTRTMERSVSDTQTDWRGFGSARVAEGTGSAVRTDRGTRSFGEPVAPSVDAGATRSNDDWRRFGGGTARTESSTPDRGWRRGTDSSNSNREPIGVMRSDPLDSGSRGTRSSGSEGWNRTPRTESPRMESPSAGGSSERQSRSYESPRVERRDWSGGWGGSRGGNSSSESIRISPPIVRERGDYGGRGSSEGMRSAPSGGDFGGRGSRSEAPHAAPAPSSGGGGGRGTRSR